LSHIYCPECGFQNPEAANFCSKCGSMLVREDAGEQTVSYTPEEVGDDQSAALQELPGKGPALVVRSGSGRAGESFLLSQERTLVGRSPECEVFLDDVTVSRRHSAISRNGDTFSIEDLGSLNGTFVNRRRIESTTQLEDDDELQIGKYRLTFLRR
jgi:pSer/pThr/pTyr-binding forkhead associated (FHA) protein/ribosomal protein L40E